VRVNDDAVMTPAPHPSTTIDPFTQMFEQFHAKTGVKKDHLSYTLLAMEWITANKNRVATPSADHNV
jgi:hypothetical protein